MMQQPLPDEIAAMPVLDASADAKKLRTVSTLYSARWI